MAREKPVPDLEVHLANAPGVTSAAAMMRQTPTRAQVVGWVVAADPGSFSMAAVHEYVVLHAPTSALPDYLLLVDEISRDPDGGLQHHRLVWP